MISIATEFKHDKILKVTEDLHANIRQLKQEHLDHIKFFEEGKDKQFFKMYEQTAKVSIEKQAVEIQQLELKEKQILLAYQNNGDQLFLKIEKYLQNQLSEFTERQP